HRRSAPPFERGCSRQKFGTIRLPVKHLFFTTTSPWLSMTTSSRPFVKISPFFTSTTNSAGKSCKLDDIHQYDTFVPMVPVVQTKVTFDEAVDLILKALKPLGAEYLHTLGNGLRSRWVDRYETKGKRSGAFASSSYGNPPYVLMNYKADVFSDVFTLSQEAGHSMHTWFAQKHQLFQNYDYPIFLAEVAATFNEDLLTHY